MKNIFQMLLLGLVFSGFFVSSSLVQAAETTAVLNIASQGTALDLSTKQSGYDNTLNSFALTAEGGDVYVSRLTLRRSGRSEAADFKKVWARLDGRSTPSQPVLSTDLVYLEFQNPIRIPQGETKILQVYGNVRVGGNSGKNVYFALMGLFSTAEKQVLISAVRAKKSLSLMKKYQKKPKKMVCKNSLCSRVTREYDKVLVD